MSFKALVQTISRCLKKEPQERFQTAGDLAIELKTLTGTTERSISGVSGFSGKKIQWKILLAISIVITALVISFLYFPWKSKPVRSVAVLPFLNMSHDPNTEYLTDGVTDGIIDTLSQLPIYV